MCMCVWLTVRRGLVGHNGQEAVVTSENVTEEKLAYKADVELSHKTLEHSAYAGLLYALTPNLSRSLCLGKLFHHE